jgi:ubiquinone/menaquinone biosynthesis C-methylase UbiE
MSIGGRIFAGMYDRMMAGTEQGGLAEQRDALLASATGSVLEIGAGTGANLSRYGSAVTSLTLIEPEGPMRKRLERLAQSAAPDATVLAAPAEDIPFDDDTFDVVVSTLVLCTVADQPRTLREIRRVLRRDGALLFIEHVRADEPKLAKRQDRMNGINRIVAHGCNCNRRTVDGIEAAGFTVTELEHSALAKAPAFVRPLVIGRAHARVDAPVSDPIR